MISSFSLLVFAVFQLQYEFPLPKTSKDCCKHYDKTQARKNDIYHRKVVLHLRFLFLSGFAIKMFLIGLIRLLRSIAFIMPNDDVGWVVKGVNDVHSLIIVYEISIFVKLSVINLVCRALLLHDDIFDISIQLIFNLNQ